MKKLTHKFYVLVTRSGALFGDEVQEFGKDRVIYLDRRRDC